MRPTARAVPDRYICTFGVSEFRSFGAEESSSYRELLSDKSVTYTSAENCKEIIVTLYVKGSSVPQGSSV